MNVSIQGVGFFPRTGQLLARSMHVSVSLAQVRHVDLPWCDKLQDEPAIEDDGTSIDPF
jgi:hypothetical protein